MHVARAEAAPVLAKLPRRREAASMASFSAAAAAASDRPKCCSSAASACGPHQKDDQLRPRQRLHWDPLGRYSTVYYFSSPLK